MSDNVCQRCKNEGDDLRTIWMACLYDMNELGIPLQEEVLLQGDPADLTLVKEASKIVTQGKTINLGGAEVTSKGVLHPRGFFTIRVCKTCRAEWLESVATWYKTPAPKVTTGTGIFMRHLGDTIEVTEEDYYRYHENRGIPRDQIPPPHRVIQEAM